MFIYTKVFVNTRKKIFFKILFIHFLAYLSTIKIPFLSFGLLSFLSLHTKYNEILLKITLFYESGMPEYFTRFIGILGKEFSCVQHVKNVLDSRISDGRKIGESTSNVFIQLVEQ